MNAAMAEAVNMDDIEKEEKAVDNNIGAIASNSETQLMHDNDLKDDTPSQQIEVPKEGQAAPDTEV